MRFTKCHLFLVIVTTTRGGSPTCSAPPAGATTYGYDSRGNRISATPGTGTAVGYTYDQANRLSSIPGQGTYTYNGDGLRMSKAVGSGSSAVSHAFTWDQAGSLPLLLTNTTQVTGTAVTATTAHIYGPGGLPLEQVPPPPPVSLVMATSATSAVLPPRCACRCPVWRRETRSWLHRRRPRARRSRPPPAMPHCLAHWTFQSTRGLTRCAYGFGVG
jgi:hypothetical protein